MKQLEKYSEEIYKCTKCGLCQSVCPVFEQTGLESAVSRGKFTLLNGVIKKDLSFSKNISNSLDLCLGCNACTEYCPSAIDAEKIITSAKYEAYEKGFADPLKCFIVSNFSSKLSLNTFKMVISAYRFLKLYKITDFISPVFGRYSKLLKLINSQVKTRIKYQESKQKKEKSPLKVVYFPGCINNYVNPSVKNAVKMVLEANGIEVLIPDFSCCGVPARSVGDLKDFIKLAKENLDKIDDDIDYLVTDCATCGSVWSIYTDVLDGVYKEKAKSLADKAININKLIVNLGIRTSQSTKVITKVTYHDPCHLKRSQGVYKEPREILKSIDDIEFIEMKDADKCCGASGTFCIVKPAISKEISSQKAQTIIDTGAEIVVTSCPSCSMGITQGLLDHGKELPIYQPVELLAERL